MVAQSTKGPWAFNSCGKDGLFACGLVKVLKGYSIPDTAAPEKEGSEDYFVSKLAATLASWGVESCGIYIVSNKLT